MGLWLILKGAFEYFLFFLNIENRLTICEGLNIGSLFEKIISIQWILLQGIRQYQRLAKIFFFDSLLCSDHVLRF